MDAVDERVLHAGFYLRSRKIPGLKAGLRLRGRHLESGSLQYCMLWELSVWPSTGEAPDLGADKIQILIPLLGPLLVRQLASRQQQPRPHR